MNDFDYQNINNLLHSRIRTAIMAVLISVPEADFIFLKKKVNATDGNLSVHLKKLEKADYIKVKKQFIQQKPLSTYTLSNKGRTAFINYIKYLENLIKPT